MKEIKSDELFANLSSFLKGKGIELADGSYSQCIRQGCALLADAVNLTQTGIARAKSEIDGKLARMRQVIHEKTAPQRKAAGKASPRKRSTPTEGASPKKKAPRVTRKPATPRPKRKRAT